MWRPRIVLLTVIFGVAAAAHIAALPVVALLGFVFMLWVAEGRRCPGPAHRAAGRRRSHRAGLRLLQLLARRLQLPVPFRRGFSRLLPRPRPPLLHSLGNAGITIASAAAALLYLALRRARYFGNTVPLLCFVVVVLLVTTGVRSTPWLWALPFLLTFIGGGFRRRLRLPPPQAGPGRRRRHRPPPSRLLYPQPPGAYLMRRVHWDNSGFAQELEAREYRFRNHPVVEYALDDIRQSRT